MKTEGETRFRRENSPKPCLGDQSVYLLMCPAGNSIREADATAGPTDSCHEPSELNN